MKYSDSNIEASTQFAEKYHRQLGTYMAARKQNTKEKVSS